MEVIGRYSNPPHRASDLGELLSKVGVAPTNWGNSVPERQHQRRLRDQEVDQLVEDYLAGATVFELAAKNRIHRTTVSGLLERRGVKRRWRVLEAADIDRATSLYATGLSCASIARILGVHASTVYLALTRVGMKMRDCHGRPRV